MTECSDGKELFKLDDIAFIRKGTINPMDFPEEEFELYSIPAYHESGKPEMRKGSEIKSSKFVVLPGDCLFSKLNPRVQKVWLVGPRGTRRQIATTELFPIVSKPRSNGEKWFLPEYLFLILKSPTFQERIVTKVLGTTASRQRLSPEDVLEEEIPCPPIWKQMEIVPRVGEMLSRIEQIKKLHNEVAEEIDTIMRGILEKVFHEDL